MSSRVLVFGTFDVLHAGHRHFFQQARALGDELYVVVARDQTVKELKGRLPHDTEETRRAHVAACPEVTQAVLGHTGDKYVIITELKPDVIALGYDQAHFADNLPAELQKRSLNPRIVRLHAYKPEQYKSSLILNGVS